MIRKVGADGTVTTIERDLQDPVGIAFDADGNLYFTEYLNFAIWKRAPAGLRHRVLGIVRMYDGGPAPLVAPDHPRLVAIGPGGEIYYTDSGLHDVRLRTINHAYGQPIISLAGNVSTRITGAIGAIATAGPPGGIGSGYQWGTLFFVEDGRVYSLAPTKRPRAVAGR